MFHDGVYSNEKESANRPKKKPGYSFVQLCNKTIPSLAFEIYQPWSQVYDASIRVERQVTTVRDDNIKSSLFCLAIERFRYILLLGLCRLPIRSDGIERNCFSETDCFKFLRPHAVCVTGLDTFNVLYVWNRNHWCY